ncbi:SDR family oxidoreductase [Modestobacter versicolor]|uniref:SDR family oxidoreductase n=1 Tax=Modestobacter versicolor TaxID=429133 RepID=UPI0034DE9C5B
MRIAVAGGTGTVGRAVVAEVARTGHESVVLAPSTGVDLTTGTGLDDALQGVDAVIDVSNAAVWTREASEAFFTSVAEHLLDACRRAGVGHLVVLSIVGADVVDLDYYYGKRRQEQLVAAGPVPWTVLRATQFFDFAAQVLRPQSGPVAEVPPMLSQPVATADLAARLVELATGPAQGVTVPIAGPERMTVAEMARRVLDRRGEDVEVRVQEVPGRTGELMAGGALTPAGEATIGVHTFAEYLETLAPAR